MTRWIGITIAAIACLGLLAVAAPPVSAAANTGGGASGMGFTCDVNTNKCICTGTWDGADCKAMAKNCRDEGHVCREKNGVPTGCDCKMTFSIVPKSGINSAVKNGNENLHISQ